jgi:hypothetical protein
MPFLTFACSKKKITDPELALLFWVSAGLIFGVSGVDQAMPRTSGRDGEGMGKMAPPLPLRTMSREGNGEVTKTAPPLPQPRSSVIREGRGRNIFGPRPKR